VRPNVGFVPPDSVFEVKVTLNLSKPPPSFATPPSPQKEHSDKFQIQSRACSGSPLRFAVPNNPSKEDKSNFAGVWAECKSPIKKQQLQCTFQVDNTEDPYTTDEEAPFPPGESTDPSEKMLSEEDNESETTVTTTSTLPTANTTTMTTTTTTTTSSVTSPASPRVTQKTIAPIKVSTNSTREVAPRGRQTPLSQQTIEINFLQTFVAFLIGVIFAKLF